MFKKMRAANRILGAMAVLLLATTASFAASPLVGSSAQGSGDEALERELEGGIRLVFLGMFRMPWGGDQDWIAAKFLVEPQQDTQIEAVGGTIFDDNGNQFNHRTSYDEVYIGNHRTHSRELIGGVKTTLTFWYNVHRDYGLPNFARMTFKFNGKDLVFRNVQTQNEAPKKN